MLTLKNSVLNKTKQVALVTLCSLCAANQAFAAIVYTNDSRQVETVISDANGNGTPPTITTPGSPYSFFDTLGQTSALNSDGFSASGSGFAYSYLEWGSRVSTFDVSFNLTTESEFTISGLISGQDNNYGSGDASISIFQGTSLLYSNSVAASNFGYEEASIYFNAILSSGDYRVLILADPYFQDAESNYSVRASIVSAVPVPAAVWLFASGLIGLFGVAHKKRT